MKHPNRAHTVPFLAVGAALCTLAATEVGVSPDRLFQADCPMAASAERDPLAARLAVSRETERFAAAHSAVRQATQAATTAAPIPRVNFIDDEIFGAMEKAGITSAPLSGDGEFLRRVSIDLTGRIPDAAAVQSFLADRSPNKRSKKIDELVASDAFVDRWAFFYDELLRVTAAATNTQLGVNGRNAFHAYFQDAVRSRKPYDQMARELIAGLGDSYASGPPNFTIRDLQNNGPIQDSYDNLASTTGGVFLGTSIFCLSCHNGAGHTEQINVWLSQKKRQDFWGMSASYARTTARRVNPVNGNYQYDVQERTTGDYLLNTTTGNKTARQGWIPGVTSISPSFILTGEKPKTGEGYRAALARMTTADPQFARAAVNYLWKELFGLGIVEPVDGFDLARQDPAAPPPAPWTIQPTHPNLLVWLGDEFEASGYDLTSILRFVTRSSAYQLSSSYAGTWDDAYTPYFARHFARRLSAEQMLDAVTTATGVPASLTVQGFSAPVAWAMQLPDPREPTGGPSSAFRSFLDIFGRGDRDATPRSSGGSIFRALTSLNNRIVTDRIKATAAGSAVKKLIDAKAPLDGIVTALYQGTLSRSPSPEELSAGIALFSNLKAGQTTATVAEDLQFALLNKLDFLFNY